MTARAAAVVGVAALVAGCEVNPLAQLQEGTAYADEVLPVLVRFWRAQELLDRADPELVQRVTPQHVEAVFATAAAQLGRCVTTRARRARCARLPTSARRR